MVTCSASYVILVYRIRHHQLETSTFSLFKCMLIWGESDSVLYIGVPRLIGLFCFVLVKAPTLTVELFLDQALTHLMKSSTD
jgi:hypothetical protein